MDKIVLNIIELSDKEFNLFREVIYEESRIKLSDMKKALVQSRLMKRLRELHLKKYSDYYDYLQSNYKEEVVNLINCITTNKTEFFRGPEQFEYLQRVVLPEYEKNNKRKLRVWNAGCSTGEEPYTAAISILNYYEGKTLPEIKILATDIDTRVLSRAVEGKYNEEDVSVIGAELLRRYFLRGKGSDNGLYMIKDSVKKIIYFRKLNLHDDQFPMKGTFDIIFCRNVVIYFDKQPKVKLFQKFQHYLSDEGYLFMGNAETLSGLSSQFDFIGNSIYRKKS